MSPFPAGPLGRLRNTGSPAETETVSTTDEGRRTSRPRAGASSIEQPSGDTDQVIELCYLTNQLPPDGAPSVIESLVEHIEAEDISITVCFFGSDDTLQSTLEAKGVAVHNFGAVTEFPQFDPRALFSMIGFFASESFDILHCHLPYSQSLGRIVATVADIDRVVSTQHNVPSNYHPVERVAERATRSVDAATVAVSGGVESAFTGSEPTALDEDGTWCTIQNGINVDGFASSVAAADGAEIRDEWNIDEDAPLFVNIARYQPQKAQRDLIAAMETVVETIPAANLLVVGWGPLEDDLREEVETRGLGDAVTITGRVPDIHGYYAAADTFVLSSQFEGLPVALLEAMAAACPVVATDIPGVREVVIEGETGQLVAPGEPDGLAETLVDVAQSSESERLGKNGYDRVKSNFSIEQMAEKHVRLYRSLVEES